LKLPANNAESIVKMTIGGSFTMALKVLERNAVKIARYVLKGTGLRQRGLCYPTKTVLGRNACLEGCTPDPF
jgi:hypothetical protein